ncbi:MAG: polysaccharide deacetylase family protein [Pseudomonadota bacterium]
MQPLHSPVFYDPSGKRAKRLRFGAWVVAMGTGLLIFAFLLSLVVAPQILPIDAQHRIASSSHPALHGRERSREIAVRTPPHSRAATAATAISGAYFAPWQDGALTSLSAHAAALTHVYPTWLQIGPDGRSLRSTDWDPRTTPSTTPFIEIAREHDLRIVPVVSNAADDEFDPHRVETMLRTPGAGESVARALVSFVDANNFDGLQIDFESLDHSLGPAYVGWTENLARTLHAHGKELSVAVQAFEDADTVRRLAQASDYLVIMAYDEHYEGGAPGPIASAGFVQTVLSRFRAVAPANKLVLGIGAYGYDWRRGGAGRAEAVSNAEAIALAAGYRDQEKPQDVIGFDHAALEPTFTYSDEDNADHEVWFLDGLTVANAVRLAHDYGTRGVSMWSLGTEDESSWRVFGKDAAPNPDLSSLTPTAAPEFIGDGELMTVRREPSAGARQYQVNRRTGLITNETYTEYPTGWLVARQGDLKGAVALTFDDGPDPRWTPQILDVLRRHGVKATFFVIGEAAVAHPDLIRRIVQDGDEIGNHSFTHPNMAHVGPERVRLELTSTQRALESITGRSVRLFRPPYNADADPGSEGELMPVLVANQSGYLAAGESIDPQDWQLSVRAADGSVHQLTGEDIVGSVLNQIDNGHAILLHDGGGDRAATVAALDALITSLEARGYRFVTMGELAGLPETTTMPLLTAKDRRIAGIDGAIFAIWRTLSALLFWGFSAAIVLGLARIALTLFLVSLKGHPEPEGSQGIKRVDVMIAAYNEEKVIVPTIHSVLQSLDVDVHVIVVDDGSRDNTGEAVRHAFAEDPRVLLLHKENGGKASALNLALERANIRGHRRYRRGHTDRP